MSPKNKRINALESPHGTAKGHSVRLRSLAIAVEQTADNIVITDRNGIIEYVNPAFEQTTGYLRQEVLGKTPALLKSGKHKDSFYKELWTIILAGKTFRGVIINKKKDGELYYADQTITPLKNAAGEITHFVSVWKDITERMRHREEMDVLNRSLEFERHKFEQILHVDEKIGTFTDLNKLVDFIVREIVGILEVERCSLMLLDETTGRLCIKGAVGLDHKIMRESKMNLGEGIAGLVAKERKPLLVKVIDMDERIGRENLPSYRTKSFLSVPILLDQKLLGVVNVTDKKTPGGDVFTDLDLRILLAVARQSAVAIENAELYKELKYLTITDPLTHLYNYRHFLKALDYEIKRFHRFRRPLVLLIMDVDDFKEYNEAFGVREGDILLQRVSDVLNANLSEVDIICRYASDEFVAILPETGILEAKAVAEKIRMTTADLNFKKKVTLSLGVVSCTEKMDRHDFILKADMVLSEAKKLGKNRVYCHDK